MYSGDLPPRRWLVRSAVAVAIFVLFVSATVSAVGYDRTTLGPGTIESSANSSTVISVQGFHFEGVGNEKKPARLVGVTPNDSHNWTFDGSKAGATWFYDVDPLDNGNLLVTSTVPGDTVVYELDPATGERVWTEQLDAEDTHDVDLINGDQLLVANMRNYDAEANVNRDRVFIYDRPTDTIVWEWRFDNHYPKDAGGDYTNDWTHVNDVDKIDEGRYLVSPRNFDQVIVINRSTKEIEMQLGADGNHSILYEQHNPDWLVSEDGTPTIVVADSEQNRIVEYARENGTWNQTWELTGRFNWPRDADRLPNGNTLVTDTLNHRVVEVTPDGQVVWEYYAAWAPYDAERVKYGGSSNGPTIADMNATGSYEVHGGARAGPDSRQTVGRWLIKHGYTDLGKRYSHIIPFIRPVWIPSWAFAMYALAGLLLIGWGLAELVYQRHHVRQVIARFRERVQVAISQR